MTFLLGVVVAVLIIVVFTLRDRVERLHERVREREVEASELRLEVSQLAQRLRQVTRAKEEPKPAAVVAPARPATVPSQASPPVFARQAVVIPPPSPGVVRDTAPESAARPVEALPVPPSQTPEAAEPAPDGFDWESLVGVKLFSAVAGVALVIAAIFFLRFSIEQGWLGPRVRVAIGALTAVGLLAFSERKAAGRYRITADALDAAGVTILYATFFAAHALWDLIGIGTAFALLVAVTILAILLSVRRSSPLIAGLGLLGGFAVPALLSTGEDNPFTLFGYLAVLNAGLAWTARQKQWASLAGTSLVFTTAYQGGWVVKFLTPEKVPIAIAVFLVFPVLAFVMLWLAGMTGPAQEGERDWHKPFRTLAAVSAMVPLLAMPVLSMPPNGVRFGWLFAFLLLLAVGYLVVALLVRREDMHLLGAVATIVVTLLWMVFGYSSEAWPAILGVMGAFAALYLTAPLLAARAGIPFAAEGRHAAMAAPLLLAAGAALIVREPSVASPWMLFGASFVLMAAVAVYAIVRDYGPAYYTGAVMVILNGVLWSARYLDALHLVPALVVCVTFSLLFLAVPVAVRCRSHSVEPQSAYFGVVGLVAVALVAGNPALAVPPWPMLVALAVLAVATSAAALALRTVDLQLTAVTAVVATLLLWETAAHGAPWPGVALAMGLAAAAFGIVSAWLAARLGIKGDLSAWTATLGMVGGQMVAIGASVIPGAPALPLLVGAHLALLLAVLVVSWRARMPALAPAAVIVLGSATLLWASSPHTGADWRGVLLFAVVPYAVFVSYPVVLGKRVGGSLSPYLAAVLANVPFFLAAHWGLKQGGFGGYLGALPLVQALVMAGLLRVLLTIEAPGERTQGRLALVAAAVLAGITVALPVQLDRQWLTVGWALEAAALAWLFRRIPHKGLLWWCLALLAAVFARLVVNPAVFAYAPRSATPILNWYLYTYATCGAAFLGVSALLRFREDCLLGGGGTGGSGLPVRLSHLAASGAVVLLFVLVNIEVADYYSVGDTLTFGFGTTLAQDLTYTLAWGVFAVVLLAVGIVMHAGAARGTALGLLVVTVLKCFLYDLARLEGLYRVASFVGLAVCLALVAVALQKYVLVGRKTPS